MTGVGLPARAFIDAAAFEEERRGLLGRAWTCAGRASDVERPGSFVRAAIAGEDVVVMRGEDLELRAFYNICRHRGTPLLSGDSGRTARIECPYHGWTYACTGALLEAPNTRDDFDRSRWGLHTIRVAIWQGFVFVTLDEATTPFETWMGEVPPWLAESGGTELVLLERARNDTYEIAANWKLCVANFQESHHFPSVHPELEALTPTSHARSFFPHAPNSKWLGGEMDITTTETVSTTGRVGTRALIVPQDRANVVFDAMMFPLLLTSLQPDYFLTYRLEPLAVARTRVVAEIFAHASTHASQMKDVFDFWDRVNAQDRAICERQQLGVTSRGYEPGPYTTADEGVEAFERMVREET